MNLVEHAFKELYPGKNLDYNARVVYSGKFKPYNANASLSPTTLTISLSKKWKQISEDIQVGLIQSLLVKIFKKPKNTFYIDLYNNFVKNLHIAVPKEKTDPLLEASFQRVNEKFFYGMVEQPNLSWGQKSFAKLGSYHYQSDEIMISLILNDQPLQLLDYVMYHEVLHKKHKFSRTKTGRSYYHTKAFRKEEKDFPHQEEIEKELAKLCRKSRIKRSLFSNWWN